MSRTNALSMDQLTDSAYYILLAMLTPKHGYAIMKFIEELTEGELKMGPATLYTLIRKLQDADLITMDDDEDPRRKTYRMTDKGRTVVSNEIERRLRMARHGEAAIRLSEEEQDR